MLGPPAGRFLSREEKRVVVIDALGAPERRRLGRRRSKAVDPEPEPTPVPTTRATIVDTEPLAREQPAATWMRGAQPADAVPALAALNRLLHAHRIATADPAVREVSLEQALVVRFGYGEGEEVSDGRWRAAVEVPPERRSRTRRIAALAPHERLAKLYNGAMAELRCEELALRAREDLDGGRAALAVLSVEQALHGLPSELPTATHGLSDRLGELQELLPGVSEAANAVLTGGEPDLAGLEHALGRLEAMLRARAIAL